MNEDVAKICKQIGILSQCVESLADTIRESQEELLKSLKRLGFEIDEETLLGIRNFIRDNPEVSLSKIHGSPVCNCGLLERDRLAYLDELICRRYIVREYNTNLDNENNHLYSDYNQFIKKYPKAEEFPVGFWERN